ncbi:MAG: tetratricopeptide repeat protein [Cyclobacteriaceae bacterium]|nr:tetratricopeptide repeat protein [Cyclobacteriaceae bacterium]
MPSNIKNIITTSAAALVVLFLGWVLLKNNKLGKEASSEVVSGNQDIPEAGAVKLLKDSLVISENPKNYSNFALRLADFYLKEDRFDSAGYYQELLAQRFPNEENWTRAGLTYYKAFENASGAEKERAFMLKAINCLNNGVSEKSPPSTKRKLAQLYVADNQQGKATKLLEHLIAEYPDDVESLYMLGIHAFQVNAFKEAAHYFGQLVKADSSHVNGVYYLAVCELKLGNKVEAKMLFEKVKKLDSSEEVKANADAYLNDIK